VRPQELLRVALLLLLHVRLWAMPRRCASCTGFSGVRCRPRKQGVSLNCCLWESSYLPHPKSHRSRAYGVLLQLRGSGRGRRA